MGTQMIVIGLGMLALVAFAVLWVIGWLVLSLIRDLSKSPFVRFVLGVVGFVGLAIIFIVVGIIQNGHG